MKIIKRLSAFLLLAAVIFSLSSCLALDNAKEHRMTFCKDDRTEIEYNGKKYLELSLNGIKSRYLAENRNGDPYYVTTPDVPVLLAGSEGYSASFDPENGIIITPEQTYCSEENYDKISEIVNEEKEKFTALGVFTYAYVEGRDDEISPFSKFGYYSYYTPALNKVDDEITAKVMETLKKDPASEKEYPEAYRPDLLEEKMRLYYITDDTNFIKETRFVTLYFYGGNYFLSYNSEVFLFDTQAGTELENTYFDPYPYDAYGYYSYD